MKKWINAIIFTLSAFSFSILIGYGLVFGGYSALLMMIKIYGA